MSAESHALELSMAAVPEAVRLLRAEVLRWLHDLSPGDGRLAASVALATTEAVGNVVEHAYSSDRGRVELLAVARNDELLIRVSDRGVGLRAGSRPGTGLGLPVIGRVSTGVTVASDSEGTTVSMRFAVSGLGNRDPGRSRVRRPLLAV